MIEVLKSFGFTEYEAKALITLISKGVLTAREIAEFSGIPRTSVYDVMASLKAKGFVEEIGKPVRFRAIPVEEMISILSRKTRENLEILREEISKLKNSEQVELIKLYRGKAVFEKLQELVENAKEEVVVLISHLKPEIKEILSKVKCRLILISSEVEGIKGEAYELKERISKEKDFVHGLILIDSNKTFALFANQTTIGIVGEGEGLVQFSKMIIEPLLKELRKDKKT
uniref:TrmB family transcriptional regulator n=1 Tax=Archaeoglobus fulgidus TaxID=2234 RepID=A0A7J2TL29_ARCFL